MAFYKAFYFSHSEWATTLVIEQHVFESNCAFNGSSTGGAYGKITLPTVFSPLHVFQPIQIHQLFLLPKSGWISSALWHCYVGPVVQGQGPQEQGQSAQKRRKERMMLGKEGCCSCPGFTIRHASPSFSVEHTDTHTHTHTQTDKHNPTSGVDRICFYFHSSRSRAIQITRLNTQQWL